MPGPGENTLIGLLLARRSQVGPTLQPSSVTKRLLGPRLLDGDALAAVDRGRRSAGRRALHLSNRPLAQRGHDALEATGDRPADVAGVITAIAPIGSKPARPEPQPCWKISTSTPNVASSEPMFIRIAFSGRKTDWKNIIRMTNVSSSTAPTTYGNRP